MNILRNDQDNCEHSRLKKEFISGQSTGDYVCQDCGKSIEQEKRDQMIGWEKRGGPKA